MNKSKKIKALGLLSGGLDSTLAFKVLQDQGIKTTAISFITPFFSSKKAKISAGELGIPLIEKDITHEHLKIVLNPRHGYGSTMNPCIDCHALMLKTAGRIMREKEFDFMFTGEVLGERPMSQNKMSLKTVAKDSGYAGYILRPLSAKLLEETKPEKEGKVDRSRLLDISGRQRKRQFALAAKYGIKNASNPAGGCLLTDPGFSNRLKDLLKHEKKPSLKNIELLKVGRHVQLDKRNKVIIGRNEGENDRLLKIKPRGYEIIEPKYVPGPVCAFPRTLPDKLLIKALKMCASYCDGEKDEEILFESVDAKGQEEYAAIYSKDNRPTRFV